MKQNECIFCNIPVGYYVIDNEFFFALHDKYPVSPGHMLIIPKRHVETWFELSPEEKDSMLLLAEEAKELIEKERRPDGFNFGINQGEAAGQTVPHLHLHVIPRYKNDVEDPEGGIRGAVPHKRKYRE